MEDLPEGKPFKEFSEDWYKGFEHGEMVGIEKGRQEIIDQFKSLLNIEN